MIFDTLTTACFCCFEVVFSNGGGFMWSEMGLKGLLRAAKLPDACGGGEVADRLAAVVYDSLPGSIESIFAGYRFFWESQRSTLMRVLLVTFVFPVFTLLFSIWWPLTLQFL